MKPIRFLLRSLLDLSRPPCPYPAGDEVQGMAVHYAIYDLMTNRGSVFVGASHGTPEFAAGNVTQWWRDFGRNDYRHASRLLILAHSAGSNGAPVRAWTHRR